MPDPASLYPQPPAQNSGLLQGDPTKIIGVIGELNRNALFQQEFAARKAIGQAYRSAITPDGGIDTNALMKGIKDNPDAGFMAGEASAGALARTHQQISNVAAAHDLATKQQDYVTNFIGSTATNPNATKNDVVNGLVALKRNIPTLPSDMIAGFIRQFNGINDRTPEGQAQLQSAKNMVRDWAMGPSSLATRVTGPPEPRTGAPTTVPLGVVNNASGAGSGAPGLIVGNRPGFTEAATAIAGQGAQLANSLTQANDTSMTRKAMLGNLEEDLNHFTPGGGADWERLAKNWANRNLPIPESWQASGARFDPKSIASQEQFNKQAAMLAQQQFAAIGGTGTDSKFESAFTTSPNEALSKLGNQGIIRLLKGNEDAIQAKNKSWRQWLKAGKGPDSYAEFSDDFNSHFDPRAFQFKYMSADDRKKYIDKMDPDERSAFVGNLVAAHKRGWVKFDPAQK